MLDGAATDDSADPEALNGSKPFFDFAGKHPLARLPIPPQQLVGSAPVATVVSTRATIGLKQVEVARDGARTQQSSKKVSYSSSTTTTTDIDFKSALGIFGVDSVSTTLSLGSASSCTT